MHSVVQLTRYLPFLFLSLFMPATTATEMTAKLYMSATTATEMTATLNKELQFGCTQRANINNMHVNLSWLKVEERLTSSLLVLMRGIDMLNAQSCLFELLAHSSDTPAYHTRHATRGLFTVPKSRTDYGRRTVLQRAMTTWNSIPQYYIEP